MNVRDHSRFRTGGGLSFISVCVAIGSPSQHINGWHDAWLCGGPIDAPAFMASGSTQDHLSGASDRALPVSSGHYRDGHFDGIKAGE